MIAGRLAMGTCVLLALLATNASGGIISSNNPYAYFDGTTLWKDTLNVAGSVAGGTIYVDADVDYAVFEPGSSFEDFLSLNGLFPGYTDPSEGREWIYAYQIDENNGSSAGIFSFRVGLDGDEPVSGPYAIPGTGDEPPTSMAFPGTSAKWNFSANLTTGETSEILLFSSPYGPERDSGDANASIASGESDQFPSPVPEPGTIVLLGLAMAVLISWFAVRRRTS